jgi:hypothetical protein
MSLSTEAINDVASVIPKKKRVWPLNVLAALLLGFSLSLSSHDPLSQMISCLSLTTALGISYFSVRRKFTWLGLLLLLCALYLQTDFLLFTFKK